MIWLPIPSWQTVNGVPWGHGTLLPVGEALGAMIGIALGTFSLSAFAGVEFGNSSGSIGLNS